MRSHGSFVTARILCLISATLLIAGCSNPSEDVRVTLCKDIVSTELGSSVRVLGAETQTKGYEHAAVSLRFSTDGGEGQAVCFYDHDAVDDTALHLSDPLSAYATSPYEVVIDGKTLSRSGLAEAIKQAMLKQGRELVDRAKKGIEGAFQR